MVSDQCLFSSANASTLRVEEEENAIFVVVLAVDLMLRVAEAL